MPTVDVFDLDKNKVGEIELSDAVFGAPVNAGLIYETVRMQMANRRRGTAHTKMRGEVRGGGRKPFRQKGTGRARQGSIRSPILVGGGTVFGPRTRDYSYTVPRKVRRGAMRSALSMRCGEGEVYVLDAFELDAPKTRVAADILRNKFGLRGALIVDGPPGDKHDTLDKSVRNIPGFKVVPTCALNVRDVLGHPALILTRAAVENIEGRLS